MNNKNITIATIEYIIYIALMALPLIGTMLINVSNINISIGIRQIGLLINSFKLSLIVSLLTILIGFFCAIFIFNHIRGIKKYYSIFMLPIPFFIYALGWMYLIKLISFIFPMLLQYSIKGLFACCFVEILAFLPLSILINLAGIRSINNKEIELGSLYNKGNNLIIKIIITNVFPYMLFIFAIIMILSSTEFSVPSMFQYNTYALDIFSTYARTGNALNAYIQCLPLAIILLIPIVVVISSLNKFSNKRTYYINSYIDMSERASNFEIIAFFISILQVLLPLIIFIINSGGINKFIDSCCLVRDELFTSIELSIFSGLICLIIAILPVRFLELNNNKIFFLLAISTLGIPGTIQAMGLLKIVNTLGFIAIEKSFILASIGCAYKFVPITVILLYIINLRIDKKQLEIASIYATSKYKYFLLKNNILFPFYLLIFFIVFFLSFAEEGIPLILMAPGKETITGKIYNYLHYGASDTVSSFAILVLLFIFFFEICSYILYRGVSKK